MRQRQPLVLSQEELEQHNSMTGAYTYDHMRRAHASANRHFPNGHASANRHFPNGQDSRCGERHGSQGEDSESEEIRFKLKVAAVVRVHGTAKRYGMEPYQRFRPAVGRGGAAAELDPQVHWNVCEMAKGVEFTLTSLSEKNGQGRWFVGAQNFVAC